MDSLYGGLSLASVHVVFPKLTHVQAPNRTDSVSESEQSAKPSDNPLNRYNRYNRYFT